MGVTVRAARPEEAGAIAPLYDWLFAPPGHAVAGWDHDEAAAALEAVIRAPDSDVLVAELDDGSLAGLCSIYRDIRSVRFGRRAWVEDLAVDPRLRSQGIGRRLLDAAKAWAREHGASHLELDSGAERTDAHRFYAREGAEPSPSLSFRWVL